MKAVVFDAFEVLATIKRKSNSFNKLSRKDGMSEHSFYGYVNSRVLSIDEILSAFNVSHAEGNAIRRKLELDQQRMVAHPDSKSFLKNLDEAGIHWIIISKSPSVYADALLNVLDVSREKVIFSWMNGEMKPQLLERACKTFRCSTSRGYVYLRRNP